MASGAWEAAGQTQLCATPFDRRQRPAGPFISATLMLNGRINAFYYDDAPDRRSNWFDA
jgi:hypothetical protein